MFTWKWNVVTRYADRYSYAIREHVSSQKRQFREKIIIWNSVFPLSEGSLVTSPWSCTLLKKNILTFFGNCQIDVKPNANELNILSIIRFFFVLLNLVQCYLVSVNYGIWKYGIWWASIEKSIKDYYIYDLAATQNKSLIIDIIKALSENNLHIKGEHLTITMRVYLTLLICRRKADNSK